MKKGKLATACLGLSVILLAAPATALASGNSDLNAANKKAKSFAAKYKVSKIDATFQDGDTFTSMPIDQITELVNMPSYGSLYSYYAVADVPADTFTKKQADSFVRYRFNGDKKWKELPYADINACTSKAVKVAPGKTVEFQVRYVFYTVKSSCTVPIVEKYQAKYKGKWSKTFKWTNKKQKTFKWEAAAPQLVFNGDKPATGKDNGKSDKKNLSDAKDKAKKLSKYTPAKLVKAGANASDGILHVRLAQNDNVLKQLPSTGILTFGKKYYVVADSMPPIRYRVAGDKWVEYNGMEADGLSETISVENGKTVEFQMKTRVYVCEQRGTNMDDYWDDGVGAKEQDKVLGTYVSKWSKISFYKNTSGGTLQFSGPMTFCR